MELLSRIGLLARGAVYFLIGGLALLLALGDSSGKTTDSKGVLRELLQQPLGSFLLGAMALGLFSYAIWRALQAINDSDHHGKDLKGYSIRTGRMLGALLHILLGLYAFNLIFVFRKPSNQQGEEQVAQWMLTLPLGQWLLAAVGAGVLIFGGSQIVIAWREKFCEYISIPRQGSHYLKSICKFGLMARGFVFMLIGTFFVQAALKSNYHEAGGLKEAWQTLHSQPYGKGLVAVVALGMISYAFFSAIEATYRKQV